MFVGKLRVLSPTRDDLTRQLSKYWYLCLGEQNGYICDRLGVKLASKKGLGAMLVILTKTRTYSKGDR